MLTSRLKTFPVSGKSSGERLQNFLKRHLGEDYSGKRIKQLIDSYGCKVNGKIELFSSYKVMIGDKVQVDIEKLTLKSVETVNILYEDQDFLICDKPANTISDSKVFAKLLQRNTLYPVHRLDKDTSGIVALARTERSRRHLVRQFHPDRAR